MAAAKYTLLIPTHDELGQQLKVADAVHHHVTNNMNVDGATIHSGRPHDAVAIWAQESPEMDSHLKQLGTHAAQVANVPHVMVTKAGKQVASWPMRNGGYRPGEGAEKSAIEVPMMSAHAILTAVTRAAAE